MTQPSRRSLPKAVHDYFIPHARNRFRPHIFSKKSLVVLLFGVLVFEGLYLAQINYVFLKTNFLASVLPGALITLTNADRTENNLPVVTPDPVLAEAAQASANDMAAKGYFSHVTPDGKQPWYWLDASGYRYSYAGQNLAVNFTDSSDVETAWMNSPTHRANIVKPEYTRVGIGVANGMYKGKEATFVVQFFATPVESTSAHVSDKIALLKTKQVSISTSSNEQATATEVLGSAVTSSPEPDSFTIRSLAISSAVNPTHTMTLFLSGAILLLLVLLGIALSIKAPVQYVEIVGSGITLLVILLGLLYFNDSKVMHGSIPDSTQSAAVINAF